MAALVLLITLEAVVAAAEILPEPPRVVVDTTYVPPTGVSRNAPNTAALTAALAAAVPGDEIVLQAGVTYQGPFTLTPKSGTGWITIRTNLIAQLPQGKRVTPADAWTMPKIVGGASPNRAIETSGAAHHYRLIGIEFMPAPGTQLVSGLISLGTATETSVSQLPHHLIIDRSYVHGHSGAPARRGLALNSAHTATSIHTSRSGRASARTPRRSRAGTAPVRTRSSTITWRPRRRTWRSEAPIPPSPTWCRPTSRSGATTSSSRSPGADRAGPSRTVGTVGAGVQNAVIIK